MRLKIQQFCELQVTSLAEKHVGSLSLSLPLSLSRTGGNHYGRRRNISNIWSHKKVQSDPSQG